VPTARGRNREYDATRVSAMRLIRRRGFLAARGQFRVVSSAPWHGGMYRTKTIVNVAVPMYFREPVPRFFRRFERQTGYRNVVGLLTAVDVRTTAVRRSRIGTVAISSGVSNSSRVGTINAIVILAGRPSNAAMVEAVKVVTEAKVAALVDLDIRSGDGRATGTSTDAVVIATEDRGGAFDYCGPATSRGRAIGRMVASAIRDGLARTQGYTPTRPIRNKLAERGLGPAELGDPNRGPRFANRAAWEAAFALDDAVRAGRLPDSVPGGHTRRLLEGRRRAR
jgi:adenosylcobinamide hydrolase